VIGLYSAQARKPVVAARDRIAAQGLASDVAGIRHYRARVLSGAEGDEIATLCGSPDFYSVSGCRDLLFHAQEQRFTLPQIADLLDALDLRFLGFENDDPAFWQRYRAHAPHDAAGVDLDAWDRFETAHPESFTGMYQFWCRRTDG